jgi:3' terminal RNA ribose 2'-O-methyltransferase Hen1
MLLTLSLTGTPAAPATDLGFLLAKHPAKLQSFVLNFGRAQVWYPEATAARCTCALLLEIDAIDLVRRSRERSVADFALANYVNDRPYVASSFLSVAINEVFKTALSGRNKDRPELAQTPLPLAARIAALPCRGGPELLTRLFAPLGYRIDARTAALDTAFPEWGDSPYLDVTLSATLRLSELLMHLYVLIPVLDRDKHYFFNAEEVDKLLRNGEAWLPKHPEKALIVSRYLRRDARLTRQALAQLVDDAPDADVDAEAEVKASEEAQVEARLNLHQERLRRVHETLRELGARRVLDLGCGEGKLIRALVADRAFEAIAGMDVSYRAVEQAQRQLDASSLAETIKKRVTLFQGSLLYRDARLHGYDAAACVEVIEHLDRPRLAAFERAVFEFARPGAVVITTPNAEYNVNFPTLPAGRMRHRDHRFEWTRAEFAAWGDAVAARHGYRVRYEPLGPLDAATGAPSQMGVFER